jgi:hypothetical protein
MGVSPSWNPSPGKKEEIEDSNSNPVAGANSDIDSDSNPVPIPERNMGSELQAKADETQGNTPRIRLPPARWVRWAQAEQIGSDAASVDSAVAGTRAKGEAWSRKRPNPGKRRHHGRQGTADAAIEQTDARLTPLGGQNEASRACIDF